METHLSSPYQNSAHVPMWTGPGINQKYTICAFKSARDMMENIIINIFFLSTENNQSNVATMLTVFLSHFLV